MFERMKQIKEQKRKAEEQAEAERKLKEKALINKTLRNLKYMVEKYDRQKQSLIELAQDAERRGLLAQYNMAANGLKIVVDSQDRANAMYLNLTISNHIKEVFNDTKTFVDSMSSISKQLSEIQSDLDFEQAQCDYSNALANISKAEERLREFSDSICDSMTDYSVNNKSDEKIDEAIAALIHSTSPTDVALPTTESKTIENNSEIDKKILELEGMLNGRR